VRNGFAAWNKEAEMTEDTKNIICDFVDLVMPSLTPYESSFYVLLLRLSFFDNNSFQVRIGKRSVAEQVGKSSRGGAQL
jgi:hypothetical protein